MNSRKAYLQTIARLPRPTSKQCDNFVDFVAGAHSWYKHLPPLPPGVEFSFFLDPNAGRTRIRTRSGESAFIDRFPGDPNFHYTWMPTADYRSRFGYWDYFCGHAPEFWCSRPDGMEKITLCQSVLSEEGEWISLPEELRIAGTCRLTGLVHVIRNLGAYVREFARVDVEYQSYAEKHPRDELAIRYRHFWEMVTALNAAGKNEKRVNALKPLIWEFHEQKRPILLRQMRKTMDQFLMALS